MTMCQLRRPASPVEGMWTMTKNVQPWAVEQEPPKTRPGMSPGGRRAAAWAALVFMALYGIAGLTFCAPHAAASIEHCRERAAYSHLKAIDPAKLGLKLAEGWSRLPDGEGVYVDQGCAFVQPVDQSTAN